MTTAPKIPEPPTRAGLEWRAATRSDAPAIHRLLLSVNEVDRREEAITLEEAYLDFDDPLARPAVNSLVAVTESGEVKALAWLHVRSQAGGKRQATIRFEIDPVYRTDAVEDFIVEWLERRAAQVLQPLAGDQIPPVLRITCPEHLNRRIAILRRHGYRQVRTWNVMRKDLREPLPGVVIPRGVWSQGYNHTLDRATMAAWNEAFADSWGYALVSHREWQLRYTGDSAFRPDLSYLGMVGNEIAGFCLAYVSTGENEVSGINQGIIGQVGVRAPWRRRGIGSALLIQSLRAFREDGLEWATLEVDADNATGAVRIYRRLGFDTVRRNLFFAKPVPSLIR